MPGNLEKWLLNQARKKMAPGQLVAGLARELAAEGLPLSRLNLAISTRHPEVVGAGYYWHAGSDEAMEVFFREGEFEKARFTESPLPHIFRGERLLRTLVGPAAQLDFPVLLDLKEEGHTAYAALPLPMGDGTFAALTLATKDPEGFSTAHLMMIDEVCPLLGLVTELHDTRRFARTLLDTYVGRQSGEKILDGRLKRGDGEQINAALYFADLRDFSHLSVHHSPEKIIDLLNDFFEVSARAIEREGGEILKFIGDALLAIFPYDDAGGVALACQKAFGAAQECLHLLDEEAKRRKKDHLPDLKAGIALHVGGVIWGNIGARRRLDFTVIGGEVNRVARLSGYCRPLGRRLILSSEFAKNIDPPTVSLGEHQLRGFDSKETLYSVGQLA